MKPECIESGSTTLYISFDNDSTNSDFIQDHIDSFFLPDVPTEEAIVEDTENLKEDNDEIPDDVPDSIADVIDELEFLDKDFDEEEEDASEAVVSIISGEVDSDEAEKILDMLLNREYDEDDEFENRSANYQVLEKPMTTGIHLDVIQLIPWTGFEMGELGDEPGDWTDVFDEWFDYITDLLEDIADVLVSGFVYVAEFLTNLDEILKDWGMRVIGAISNFFSAVRDAASEVGELLSSLVNWVKDFVRDYIEPIFEDIKDYMDEYIEGVISSYEKALDEYEKTGSISEETAKEVFDSLMDDMFYIIFGLATTLMFVFNVLEGVSLGAGSIVMLAVPLLVRMIPEFFGDTMGEAELVNLPEEYDVSSILEYAKGLTEAEEELGKERKALSDGNEDALWLVGDIIFGMWGLIMGGAALVDAPNPLTYGIYSVVCSFISLLFSFYSLAATGLAELITGMFALVYGTAGTVLGALPFYLGPTSTNRGFGLVGTTFSSISVLMGVQPYV